MELIITGVHQRTAPVALRERLAFPPATLPRALQALQTYAEEGFIVSTCNRVEVYGLVADADRTTALQRFIASWHGMALDELAPYLYTLTGADAVRHLFRLTAGLDSMVIGEDQIMGQVKAAMGAAQEGRVLGPALNRLLTGALASGKLVRTNTGIARNHLSVVSVALSLARQTWGGLAGRRVLIVGAGRMAELALKHLHGEAVGAITVVNRSVERAQALAARHGVAARPFSDLAAALGESDVVLSCTSAPGTVIDAALVEHVVAGREGPLLLIDLAVPRDIERRAGSLMGVRLIDVDDMQEICAANRNVRMAEIAAAEALVEGEVTRYMEWWSIQEVVPTIRALRQRAEAIRDAELQRTLALLPNLSPREQEAIQALSAAIVNKLLHQPIATLKDPTRGGQLAQVVQQLFQLSEERYTHAVES